jgi:hypothetical protein
MLLRWRMGTTFGVALLATVITTGTGPSTDHAGHQSPRLVRNPGKRVDPGTLATA